MIKFQGIGAQGNYSQAGKAVADDTLRSFLAARRSSPNYGEIAVTAADIRKNEKLATLKNQAEVAAARLTADADVKASKMKIDGKSKLLSASRKAGALGLAGQLFGRIPDAGGEKPLEPYKGRYSREDLQGDIDKFESQAKTIKDGIVVPEKPDFSTPGLSTQSSSGGGSGSTNSGVMSTYTPPKPGKIYSQDEMETLAVQGGFDPKDAPLVAKIAMGESSGDPTAFNGVGRDQSYGLMQINMLGDMGPERRAQFGISSNEELNDPLTNMKAAYAIYKQQGWNAWGAYNNGSYAKF